MELGWDRSRLPVRSGQVSGEFTLVSQSHFLAWSVQFGSFYSISALDIDLKLKLKLLLKLKIPFGVLYILYEYIYILGSSSTRSFVHSPAPPSPSSSASNGPVAEQPESLR